METNLGESMLIKYKDKLFNASNLTSIERCEVYKNRLWFMFSGMDRGIFFSSPEEADKAFECITDAYRWQRQVCDLDDYLKK